MQRAERRQQGIAAYSAQHPMEHNLPWSGCGDCHNWHGPIAGCSCSDCQQRREGGMPESELHEGRMRLAHGAREAAIPTPGEIAAERETTPSGRGDGSGRGHADGPSERQVAFITKLMAEKGVDEAMPTSKRAASRMLDHLLTLPTPKATTAPAEGETPVGRWAKINGCWMVRIGGTHQEGDVVTVLKGGSVEQQVTLGVQYDVGVWNVAQTAKATEASTECPEGIHRIADGTVYKVYRTQTSGNLAAKRLIVCGDHGEFEYETGAIRRHNLSAATLLDHEEAARFGALYGFCCACGRELETEESLEAGYGPKCATRYGWPWGRKQRVAAK